MIVDHHPPAVVQRHPLLCQPELARERAPPDRDQHHFRLDDSSELGKIFKGSSPENNGSEVQVQEERPEGAPNPSGAERVEEFSPGLTPEIKRLVEEKFQI